MIVKVLQSQLNLAIRAKQKVLLKLQVAKLSNSLSLYFNGKP